jgi:hypothetical protein
MRGKVRLDALLSKEGLKAMEVKTVYFDNPGRENTDETLRLAKQRADELGIKTILVASTGGDTAVKAADVFKGSRVIAVSHVTGMREPDFQEFTAENRKIFEGKGGIVVTATHALSGLNRAISNKYGTATPGEIVADTLRTLGQGIKVVIEITLMAVDSGLVRTDGDIIAIGGTGRGADTAVVLKPTNSHTFFNLRVREILCKPHY